MTRTQRIGLVLGPLVFAAIAFVPSGLHQVTVAGGGFGRRPAYAAAVAALMAVWWFTEALPIAWTACLPLALYPALGVFGRGPWGDVQAAAAPFGDAYIFLFMGGMALGAAMEHWGLHRRVALHIMSAVGTDAKRLLLGMLVATASVSLWISNTATAVMMLPIAMALIAQLEAGEGRRLQHFGAALTLAVAYAANVGGIGTKIGTGTNSIFVGFVSRKMAYDVSFLHYMALGLPFVVLMVPILWWVLLRVARRDVLRSGQGREVLERELRGVGPLSGKEKVVAAVFVVAAGLWIAGDPLRLFVPSAQGKHYEAAVAMAAALALWVAGALPLQALKRVPWSTLVLLGGSFAMAAGIEGSGLQGFMGEKLMRLQRLPLTLQVGLASGAAVVISAVASNTATINLLLNVLPRSMPVLTAAAIAASCDFALPAGTPPNAIVFGAGYVRLPVMMRTGVLLDIAAAVLITLYVLAYVQYIV